MTNEELAKRIKAGEVALLPELWKNCSGLLKFFMNKELSQVKRQRMERYGVTEEDLVQELYFAMLEAVKAYKPESGFKLATFMKYPVKNTVNSVLGFRGQEDPIIHASSIDSPIVEGEETTLAELLPDPESGKALEVIESNDYNRALHEALEEALGTLPTIQEKTIRAYYYDGKPITTIAEDQHRSHQSVSNDKYDALMQLREAQVLESYRDDIIASHSYNTGLRSFRYNGASSVELTVSRLVMEEERMKRRAHRVAMREIEELRKNGDTCTTDVKARNRKQWR